MITTIITAVLAAAVALGLGFVLGGNQKKTQLADQDAIAKKEAEKITQEAQNKAKSVLQEAEMNGENIKKSKLLEAKEKFLQIKSEWEKEELTRLKKVEESELRSKDLENRMKSKEGDMNKKIEETKKKETEVEAAKINYTQQLETLNKKKQDLDKAHEQHIEALEKVAGLSAVDAKNQLIQELKDEANTMALSHVKEIMDEAKVRANKEAKKIIIQTIQRTAAEQTIENTVSVFHLENDDMKGQIIGREGRNIRALESECGVELVVDDTPETIMISGYDPVRREVARLSLQRLVNDGRIHPARIEEVVAKTRKQMDEQIMEIGERVVIELGINGLHTELIRMVGRMRFRSSYGQNLLMHSKEVANLCATMAAELGLNPKMAKRAGLLHDIGKVPDQESELSHALLGMKLCEEYKEHASICNAVGAHHDEVEMTFIISPIVQACDSISGSRPGARREILESYLKRIKDLENLAIGFEGVDKAFAIQAGRELRVIVEAEKVTDKQSEEMSFQIADKIMKEMTYPGQIRVTVIREKRTINIAR